MGLARRFPRTYEIYFRQSSGQRCAQELEGRWAKPDLFKRGFMVYRVDHLRRPFLEKPLSLDPPAAVTTASSPGPSTAATGPTGPSAPGPSGPSTSGPSASSVPPALAHRRRRARRAPPIPDSVSVADSATLLVLGFHGVICYTD
jgi:hypothetical protein